jgi:adenine-specific DNA-methyltransferase
MGSKRNILDFVVAAINEIRTGENQYLYDLFAGSSIVSGAFREIMPVSCNDIQSYSKVIGGIYLNNYYWDQFPPDILEGFVHRVSTRVEKFMRNNPLSFYYTDGLSFDEIYQMEEQQRELLHSNFNGLDHLFVKYFSGTYWSYEQCIYIDAIASIGILFFLNSFTVL